MYDIAILTTAIIRPAIHIKAFSSLKKFITRHIKILWIINLDFVNIFHQTIPDEKITEELIQKCFYQTSNIIKSLFKQYNVTFEFISAL